jgi:hypothetical protein
MSVELIGAESIGEWIGELDDRWGSFVVSCCCETLVAEARVYFGNPEEEDRPPLEAATKQRLVKTWLLTLLCM